MSTQRPAVWDSPELVQLRLDDGATSVEEREAERAALARDLREINARLEELSAAIKAARGDSALAANKRGLKTLKKALTDRLRELEHGGLPAPGLQSGAATSAHAGAHWGTASKTDLPYNEWLPSLFS
ncbi:hypothetical protein [Corynebacterium minutissimum]|uniref:Uncharacterized protein n=1 Tax=Corynebacterium minutissimum TaxID=38301 RepID=A0A7T3CV26_9CORY|nr:hypothetical protein [Corynebacterium minutissimum]KHO30137.1 hypothetical protein NX84_04755 [Corynebacterium minutissimum]QPS60623.1 hypothetical protein I6G51_05435 [Corynebacterium minutissimum]QQA78590.1 hypothetical protein I6H49_07420 [Corynebacterium minutissimum]